MEVLGIVGAGTMGRGIAQLALQSGLRAVLHDADPAALEKSRVGVRAGLDKAADKGKLSKEQACAAQSRLETAHHLSDLGACDLVVEAVFEDLELKRRLFHQLDRLLPMPVTLATNTSSFLVADVAAGCERPERVVGLHFFNPPVAMRLVEVIKHPSTSEKAASSAWDLALQLKREPVAVKDGPGFIVNRVVRSYYLVAQRLAGEGAGTLSGIDAALEAQGLPMGPFALMDFIGLEVNLAISKSIYAALGSPERFKPHWLQERLVMMGFKGVKSAAGFYLYNGGVKAGENPAARSLLPAHPKPLPAEEIFRRVMAAIHQEAELMVREGVASSADIDKAVELGVRFPRGPFAWGLSAEKA